MGGLFVVPNWFPEETNNGIAIVGEAPGHEELQEGRPFVGKSGKLLRNLLWSVDINPEACFFGNVCQHHPVGNDITTFEWEGEEIQEGFQTLLKDLEKFKPKVCVLLGRTALKAFEPGLENPSIAKWRGRAKAFQLREFESKYLVTYHPAAALRGGQMKTVAKTAGKDGMSGGGVDLRAIMLFDLRKALALSRMDSIPNIDFDIRVNLTLEQLLKRLEAIRKNKTTVAVDIEGHTYNVLCISFAESSTRGFTVPFVTRAGERLWCKEDEKELWEEVAAVLEDAAVPKVFQNGLYDMFALKMSKDIDTKGVADDTMLKHWECFCELPGNLDFQASIYTFAPLWKHERMVESDQVLWEYCAKDSCITLQIAEALNKDLRDQTHYKFNVGLLQPLLYMETRGIKIDQDVLGAHLERLKTEAFVFQSKLNDAVKLELPRWEAAKAFLCTKRAQEKIEEPKDMVNFAFAKFKPNIERIVELYLEGYDTPARRGELSVLLGVHLNPDSSAQISKHLYETLGLSPQYTRVGNQRGRLTTSTEALLNLVRVGKEVETLNLILGLRRAMSDAKTIAMKLDQDGRVRTSLNPVASTTGRCASSKSDTGSGGNLQTIPKRYRDMMVADHGKVMGAFDLEGADGWTIAAYSKLCGDPTMLRDLEEGVKPAKVLVLMRKLGDEVNKWSVDKLKEECKQVDGKDWVYMASKRVLYGSCYMMGLLTMRNQIAEDAFKKTGTPVFVPISECRALQACFFRRYPGVKRWHRRTAIQIRNNRSLTSASGQTRTFLKHDQDSILRDALAHECQANTTFVLMKVLERLWKDPDNWRGDKPLVEPLLVIHDELLIQWPEEKTKRCLAMLRKWKDVVLEIAGTKVRIPTSGGVGKSWKEAAENEI